jgi:16S rRNA (cytosine1402-N4)-methyltransferase
MMQTKYHAPVMLNECMEALAIDPKGIYVDVTFGGGGHSNAILAQLGENGKLVAFDQDADAQLNVPKDQRLYFIDQNFEYMANHLAYQNCIPVNGILADLGVSSHQFDEAGRGFSFRFDDAELDMRMNASTGKNAADLLNTCTQEQLADMLYLYGELKNARSIASSIVAYRTQQEIKTVLHLKEAIKTHTPKFGDYKFFAQVFQALRIEVNREMEVLKKFLEQSAEVLASGGHLVVMSYHSLEDRLVKNFMASGNFQGVQEKDFYGNVIKPFEQVQKKVITASEHELQINPRSRSAKLRIAKKK